MPELPAWWHGLRPGLPARFRLQILEVCNIPAPSSGSFVGGEIVQRNEMYRHAEKRALNPVAPRRIELYAVDVRCRP
jgi:hypothetical protein